jgi:hypothetical protein
VPTLSGLPTDVWVFEIGITLTTGPGSSVVGTSSKCNILWQVGSSATLDTTTTFEGTVIALQSISMNNGVTFGGRALARDGAVTLIDDTIDPSDGAGRPPSGGSAVTLPAGRTIPAFPALHSWRNASIGSSCAARRAGK